MRCWSLGSFVAVGLAVLALVGAPSAAAEETLAASCQPTENIFNAATGDHLFGQAFSPQLSGNLTRVEQARSRICLQRETAPTRCALSA